MKTQNCTILLMWQALLYILLLAEMKNMNLRKMVSDSSLYVLQNCNNKCICHIL